MNATSLGPIVQSYFMDYLKVQKGLQPDSIWSYRDVLRLLLRFVAADRRCAITRLRLDDLTHDRVLSFLRHLEEVRGNKVGTRNHRLAAIHTFFEYIARREPDMLGVCQQVAMIPFKRTAPPEIRFLERDEVTKLLQQIPPSGRWALRDRAILLFLYNTGARAREVAALRAGDLDLGGTPVARLRGKGGKWRTCPLWDETVRILRQLTRGLEGASPDAPVFASFRQRPLTRTGIYRIVRRHARRVEGEAPHPRGRRISPHTFRHTTAVHLLEAGVEVNVIRGWLGHADLKTTNRYAEITVRTKEAALRICEPPSEVAGPLPRQPAWRNDPALLKWLASL